MGDALCAGLGVDPVGGFGVLGVGVFGGLGVLVFGSTVLWWVVGWGASPVGPGRWSYLTHPTCVVGHAVVCAWGVGTPSCVTLRTPGVTRVFGGILRKGGGCNPITFKIGVNFYTGYTCVSYATSLYIYI